MSDDWDDASGEDGEDDDQTGPCPECGTELHVDAEACYACGHWLTAAERHKLWDGGSQVRGAMGVGKVALVLILIALMSGLLFFLL